MKNISIILIISLFLLASCGGGGGSSSNGGGGTNNGGEVVETVNKTLNIVKDENIDLEIPLNATDIVVEKAPSIGELDSSENYSSAVIGEDTFQISYKVDNKKIILNVVVKILEPNSSPVLTKTDFFVERGNGIIFDFEIIDEEPNLINYQIVEQPSVGLLYFFNDNGVSKLAYDADNSLYQTTFKVRIIDQDGLSDEKVISITSTGPNTNPYVVEAPLSFTFNEDSTNNLITYTASDDEDAILRNIIVVNPSNGSLTGNYPNYNYTPNENYNGSDSFTIELDDQRGGVIREEVSIEVTSINDIPTGKNKVVDVFMNSSFNVYDLEIVDPDHNTFQYNIISDFSNGIGFINDEGFLTYIPNQDFIGQDILEYQISDGIDTSSNYTVIVNVSEEVITYPINLEDEFIEMNMNELAEVSIRFEGNIGDVTLSYEREPVNGNIFYEDGVLIYIPNQDYTGQEIVEIKLTDTENNESNVALIVFDVSEKNYNLYGFNFNNELKREKESNEIKLITDLQTDILFTSSNSSDLSFYLRNPDSCNDAQELELDLINLIGANNFSPSFINNETISLTDSECQDNFFNLLSNGDTVIQNGDYVLLKRENTSYLGINTSRLESLSSISSTTINAVSYKDVGLIDYSKNVGNLNEDVFFTAENELGQFNNYLKIVNGNIRYNNLLTNYYSLVIEENNIIKTKGIFVKNESGIMEEITSIEFECEAPSIELNIFELADVEYFDGKTPNDILSDSTILMKDQTEEIDLETLSTNIDYIVEVPDKTNFTSLEEVSGVGVVNRTECQNGVEQVDVSGENGRILLLPNSIIYSLDLKFNEEFEFDGDGSNPQNPSIQDIGSHLIIYDFDL